MLATLHMLVEDHHLAHDPIGGNAEDARAHRAGRLEALQAIAPGSGRATDLELLVRDHLRAFQFGDAPGIVIEGPSLSLRPAAARLLALVLHELTTNAIKFGVLGEPRPDQSLHIAWQKIGARVQFLWQEGGISILALAGTRRAGFGQYLIETLLPLQFDVQSRFALLPGGVQCALLLPDESCNPNFH